MSIKEVKSNYMPNECEGKNQVDSAHETTYNWMYNNFKVNIHFHISMKRKVVYAQYSKFVRPPMENDKLIMYAWSKNPPTNMYQVE